MAHTYWHKQTAVTPLYPDLVWSRPEHKSQAGKLLVVGGNVHGFAAPASAYIEAQKAGAGSTRVLLPVSVKKLLPKGFFETEFAPSTPSGSFSQQALAELQQHALWADSVLLAGDFGRNSETAVLLERFAATYSGRLTIAKDTADYFLHNPQSLLKRTETTLVISFAQLQKLAVEAKFTKAFTFDMDFLRLIDMLHEFSSMYAPYIIVKHLETIFVAVKGQITTTMLAHDPAVWRVAAAAHAAVWWMQNSSKPLEALTTSCLQRQS